MPCPSGHHPPPELWAWEFPRMAGRYSLRISTPAISYPSIQLQTQWGPISPARLKPTECSSACSNENDFLLTDCPRGRPLRTWAAADLSQGRGKCRERDGSRSSWRRDRSRVDLFDLRNQPRSKQGRDCKRVSAANHIPECFHQGLPGKNLGGRIADLRFGNTDQRGDAVQCSSGARLGTGDVCRTKQYLFRTRKSSLFRTHEQSCSGHGGPEQLRHFRGERWRVRARYFAEFHLT